MGLTAVRIAVLGWRPVPRRGWVPPELRLTETEGPRSLRRRASVAVK